MTLDFRGILSDSLGGPFRSSPPIRKGHQRHIFVMDSWTQFVCPVIHLVKRRTPSSESPRSRRFDGLYLRACWRGSSAVGSGGRSQWSQSAGGPFSALWVRLTFGSKFCRIPGTYRSKGGDQDWRNTLCLARSPPNLPFKKLGLNP